MVLSRTNSSESGLSAMLPPRIEQIGVLTLTKTVDDSIAYPDPLGSETIYQDPNPDPKLPDKSDTGP